MTDRRFPVRNRFKEAWRHLRDAATAFRRIVVTDGALETLTPILLDRRDSKRYEDELERALMDPMVRNIAITGGYGAGKSSLIRTFKERHRGFDYASVSLATFRKEGKMVSSADDKEAPSADTDLTVKELVERIEETIVQQLLYAVPATKLPRTRLKRIMQPSRLRAFIATVLLVAGAIALIRLYLIAAFPPQTLEVEWLTGALLWIPSWLALVTVVGIGACAIYQVARSLSLLNIDGWSIKGGTIESMQHSSVLHKNVDEIVYCFQNSSIDVVVVEDLDRFGVQDVFFRLREINAIINEAPQIKRTIRFIYALNDELFAGGEKTKFFDVVLPVVPVINKENSHAKMVELLKRRRLDGQGFASQIDDQLIESVCFRIDDMRLVKNIVNELDVFAQILMTDLRLNWNKLFAMMVVKNLHSDLYWQLTKRSGFLFRLITGYADWRGRQTSVLKEAISGLETMLLKKQADVARSRLELRVLAWYHVVLRADPSVVPAQIQRDGASFSLSEFVEDDVFDGFATSKSAHYIVATNGARSGQAVHVPEVLEEMDYLRRYIAIAADDEDIHAELRAKHAQLADLQSLPLARGLREGYRDEFSDELKGYDTIKYLLDAGHLDQDYPDYLGHFYGHSIGSEDMALVLVLRQGEACDVAVPIADPEKFLKKLRLENIDKGRGIIADLLSYLCRAYVDAPGDVTTSFLRKVLDDAPADIDRFSRAVDLLLARREAAHLVRAVYALKSTLFVAVLGAHGPSESLASQALIVAMLDELDADEIQRLDTDDSAMSEHIAALSDVSLLVPHLTRRDRGWPYLRKAGVRFAHLAGGTPREVLEALIATDALAPSLPMLQLICSEDQDGTAAGAPITLTRLVATSTVAGMQAFVARYPATLVRELLSQPGRMPERPDVAMHTLTAIASDESLARRYFERSECVFATLDLIDRRLWASALEADRITDRAGALRAFEAWQREGAQGDADDGDVEELRRVLVQYAVHHAAEIAPALGRGKPADTAVTAWILTEVQLSDDMALSLLSAATISDPTLLTAEVTDSRLERMAAHGRLAISEAIWQVVSSRPLLIQAAYVATGWALISGTTLEDQLGFALICRLYLDGVMSVDDALRVLPAQDNLPFEQSPEAIATLTKLAADAIVANLAFPAMLSQAAARAVQELSTDKVHLKEVMVHAIPVMKWPTISAILRSWGGDWISLRPGKNFSIKRSTIADAILAALAARQLFTRFEEEGDQVKGRMRRTVA
jgi:hypothetical protein